MMYTKRVINKLNENGVRITPNRQRIIEIISEKSKEKFFTAEEICFLLPNVGRATVYRTIRTLEEFNLLCKVVLPGNEMAYTVGDTTDAHHHHVVCKVCNRVRKFKAGSIERAVKAISASSNGYIGDILEHRIELYDMCPQCKPQ